MRKSVDGLNGVQYGTVQTPTSEFKILLWMPTAGVVQGGHRVQLERTAAALRRLGVDAVTSLSPGVNLSDFDIIHGFGLDRTHIRACRTVRARVALSTIYWSLDYTQNQRPWATRVRFGLALLRSALEGRYRDKCRAMTMSLNEARTTFEMADLLLPNSRSEAACIRRELGVSTPMCEVPNAVDDELFTPSPAETPRPIDVLYCGRFEPHKNQLGLIRAMRGTGLRTVLAGPPHADHPDYYRQCQRDAAGNVKVIPGTPHDELPILYRQATVHVLPSWYETTGLVSLEAALSGCNIVTTNKGFASDYFGEMATYCDPSSPSSIRDAIAIALRQPVDSRLRSHILERYTWRHTALATVAAYEATLCGGEMIGTSSFKEH